MKAVFKWAKRLGLGLLAFIILLGVILTLHIGYDANFGARATDVANITFTDAGGNTLNGYLASPEGPGPHPSILLIHEWWGLNTGMTVLADALAQEGYLVLAPDVYQNQVTSSFNGTLYYYGDIQVAAIAGLLWRIFDRWAH